ncbi:MAG TPA: metal ABC transporter permease [Acidimicrobiales bacterium]|jgi:zinc/manganese transport system permease protein
MLALAPLAGISHFLGQEFTRNAAVAGGAIAVAAGMVGYFLVVRAQVFTGDALGHAAFTGALAALAAGLDVHVGLFAGTILVALLLGALGPRGRADDVVIGSVFAWLLGLGVLFLSLYTTSSSTGDSRAGITVLFGSIFGLSGRATLLAVLTCLGVVLVLTALARPLLFASFDEAVASARGVPVRLLGTALLVLVAVTAAEAAPAVGALQLLGLLTGPAATALLLTRRPFRALALSGAVALVEVWLGLALAYAVPSLPPTFAIMAVIVAGYGAARVANRAGRRVEV